MPSDNRERKPGLDLAFRQALSLRITRFDQRASGFDSAGRRSRRLRTGVASDAYELENVGEIANRGWEMEAAANLSRLTVSGTLSFVDSRVEKLATGYNGDLMTGDRMLQVPARTGSAQRVVARPALVRVARRLARARLDQLRRAGLGAARTWAATHPAHELVGPAVAAILAPVQRRASACAHRRRATSATCSPFEVSGENLFNHQTERAGQHDDGSGRTIMTGVRLKF